MKKVKPLKTTHTNPSPKGMGDYYGTGVRNRMGKAVDVFSATPVKAKNIGKPPKSVA